MSRSTLRKASVCAAGAQILQGLLAVNPELFNAERAPVPRQFFDGLSRTAMFLQCSILAIFFMIIYRDADSLDPSRPARFAPVTAAATLTVENILPTFGTIIGAIAASSNLLGWEYNPFKQFVYVLVPTIPTLATASLIVFLLLIFSLPPNTVSRIHDPRRYTRALRVVSFAAVVASVSALLLFFYSVITAPQLPSTLLLSLRLLTLVSLSLFFWVLCTTRKKRQA